MKYLILFFGLVLSTLFSCSSMKDGQPTIKQGVYGKVIWQEGNMMPSPDAPVKNAGKPIERTLRIYELTTLKQVSGDMPLFKSNSAVLVAETKSDTAGNFQCKLKAGMYSIFTVEPENELFANLFNDKGEIAVFEVKDGTLTKVDININYKAAF